MTSLPPAPEPGPADAPVQTVRRSPRKRRSAFRHRAELLLFRAAAGVLGTLPASAARRAGRAAARAAFSLLSSRREILLRNLGAAYPDDPPERIAAIAKGSIDSFASALVDFLETGRLSREELLSRVWGVSARAAPETRTVDVHVARLRTKLRDHGTADALLVTVRGKGYRLDGTGS